MKTWTILLAMLALTMSISIASACKRDAQGNKIIEPRVAGAITAIDGANVTIQPNRKKGAAQDPAPVVVADTANTTVRQGREKLSVKDLAIGQHVVATLTPDSKTAITVTIGKAKAPAKPAA